MTAPGIVENPVLHTVERVAGIVHRVRNYGNFSSRNITVALSIDTPAHRCPPDIMPRPIIRRIAGDDAVKISRIALRFDQRFMTALRASAEVRMRRLRAVKRMQNGLVRFRHNVNRAIGKIDDALVVAQRPGAVAGVRAFVSGVRAARRVSLLERIDHRRVADGSSQSSVTDGHQLPVSHCAGIQISNLTSGLTTPATLQNAGT